MKEQDFIGNISFSAINSAVSAGWRSPSNIALVKYWGKKDQQIPLNPSLSMTLLSAYSETKITASPLKGPGKPALRFLFEGKPNPAFSSRIEKYIRSVTRFFPFLEKADLLIESKNTFPHSSGIASSASAYSAMALCLCDLEEKISGQPLPDFFRKASFAARLGSGSAGRSVYGGMTIWGKSAAYPGSSDLYAEPVPSIHPMFSDLRDAILIVSHSEKSVSSSKGHELMNGHPFANARIQQANNNTANLLNALEIGDQEEFIRIVENEALSLHALMMASNPGFMLMEPETMNIIRRIQRFREEENIPVCFTLDAGPNVHLLYFEEDLEQVHQLIVEDLLKNNKQKIWIDDKFGAGPEKFS